jgi:MPBQ/MSBQ methyltransferase
MHPHGGRRGMRALSTRIARLARGPAHRDGAKPPDPELVAILACPETKDGLRYDPEASDLVCDTTGKRYAVADGIPVLLAPRWDRGAEDPASFGPRYDRIISAPAMRALYGGSDYFNVGLWEPGVATLTEACDRMVDALAAPVPPGPRLILDVGCGFGAGTRRLAARFETAAVVGINISLEQLVYARARGLGAAVVGDAARLGIASGVADAVIACESPQHFDTRADFFAEAWRVLRPGGVICLADMLYVDREPIGAWMYPAGNAVTTASAYAELLAASGFRGLEVRDVTAITWTPFCTLMSNGLGVAPAGAAAIRNAFAAYVIATARKPA